MPLFKKLFVFAAVAAFLTVWPAFAQTNAAIPNVVKYEATIQNVKYNYCTMPAVAHVRSGDIIEANTLDCFGDAIQHPGDTLSMVKGDNPLTGPFYIDGAEPGDTLAIRFLSLSVNGKQGIGALAPGFGALNSTDLTPMINTPLPERIWFYPIDPQTNTATFQADDSHFTTKIPIRPFLGCIGVAPAEGESRSSVVPGNFGGNMDAPEASVGNTLYLPVNVPGALLYFGDGHAAMGDGEIAGTAIEVPLRVRLQVQVIKHRQTAWPRFENDHELMAAGITRPLDDSLRIAFAQLVDWIHQAYGLSNLDAYELLSKVARIRLAEMVDPNYVIIAKIDKRFLPEQKRQP